MSETAVKDQEVKKLNANDRCDQCGSQAYVSVSGMAGELMFCSHHFTKIEKNEESFKKLKDFAFIIHDERESISSKRQGI